MERKATARFSPGNFAYNNRVACAIIPGMSVMIGFGGMSVAAICTLGAILSYILDATRQKEGALAAIWITLAAANLSLISASSNVAEGSRPLLLSLLILGSCSLVLFQTGCWATLQFRWVQIQYPPVVLALERLVVSGCITCCCPMLAWGLVAAVGASQTPFYLAFAMSGYFYLCGTPIPSSFHQRGSASTPSTKGTDDILEHTVQGRFESACMASLTSMLPALMYAGLHLQQLSESTHFWSLLLVWALPTLAVLLAPKGLWWLPLRQAHTEYLRFSCALITFAVLVAGVEGRVILPLFRQYVAVHPPWDWLLVTLAVYGHGATVLLHFTGALRSTAVYTAVLAGLLFCCFAACIAVGLPIYVVPGPLISASGLGLYYRSRSMAAFALFLAGAGVAGVWFILHHFWFLAISWGQVWSVQAICKLLFLYTGPTLMLPGLLLSRAPGWITGATFVAHAILLLVSEVGLMTGNGQFGDMYPPFAVLMTSAVGMFVINYLETIRQDLPLWSRWASAVIYGTKASLLILPRPDQAVDVAWCAAAIALPLTLQPQPDGRGRAQRIGASGNTIMAGLTLLALWNARHVLFGALSQLLGLRLTEAVALGSLLLASATSLLPLLRAQRSRSTVWWRMLSSLAIAAVLLVILRPPLPDFIVCRARHSQHQLRLPCLPLFQPSDEVVHEADDVAIYGSGAGHREHWASWLLVVACLAGLGATGQQNMLRTHGLMGRLLLSLLCGGAVGGYITFELFPHQPSLQILVLGTCLLVSSTVVLISLPTQSTPRLTPLILLIWFALLPATVLLERDTPAPGKAAARMYSDAGASMEEEHKTFRLVSLLAVYAVQSVLIAFSVKMKLSQSGALASAGPALPNSGRSSATVTTSPAQPGTSSYVLSGFLGSCIPKTGISFSAYDRATSRGRFTGDLRLQMAGLGWLPTAGNVTAALGLILSLMIGTIWFEGREVMVVPLSSMLLLLHQDPVLLPMLTEQKRYAPPFAAAVCYLVTMSGVSMLPGKQPLPGATSTSVFLDMFCLLLTLPSITLFLGYLWTKTKHKTSSLLITAPLNIVAIALTNHPDVRLLAGIGILAAGFQWFGMSYTRRVGLQML